MKVDGRRQFCSHIAECFELKSTRASFTFSTFFFSPFFGLSLALVAVKLLKNLVVSISGAYIIPLQPILNGFFLFVFVPTPSVFCSNKIMMAIKRKKKNGENKLEKGARK